MDTLVVVLFLFFIGTIFGSFGSVLLVRRGKCTSRSEIRKETKTIFLGRSYCPECKITLKRYNLIPLVSFLIQGGKCTYCHKPISNLYPLLEILSGLIFIGSFLGQHIVNHDHIHTLLYDPSARIQTLFHRCLLLLLVWDVLKYELHMPLRIIATGIGVLYISMMKQGGSEYFWAAGKYFFFITTLFVFIYLGAHYYVSTYKKITKHTEKNMQEGFGMGDVYMSSTLSIFFPLIHLHHNIPLTILTASMMVCLFVTLSAILGIIWYLLASSREKIFRLNGSKKQKTRHQLPFLPPMIIAFWILLFWGKWVRNYIFGLI